MQCLSYKEINSKISGAKCWPFCFSCNVLKNIVINSYGTSQNMHMITILCMLLSFDCSSTHEVTLRYQMSSNGNIFHVTGHLCGEFTGPGQFPTQRPVTWSFDVVLDLHLKKRLSKQWWGWWLEMLLHPLWSHRNVVESYEDFSSRNRHLWYG